MGMLDCINCNLLGLKYHKKMKPHFIMWLTLLVGIGANLFTSSQGVSNYDYSAPIECKHQPDRPLYGGGLLKDQEPQYQWVRNVWGYRVYVPTYILPELIPGTYYAFSSWVKTSGGDGNSTVVWANVGSNASNCGATVIANQGCWSFLKGGFFLNDALNTSVVHFEDFSGNNIHIDVASSSLQPFSEEEWAAQQQDMIEKVRKREGVITVSNQQGLKLQGANITVEQISSAFPFGTAISKAILSNVHYQ
ncbi:unnamed protein product, partial [Cuscuta europaea]